MRAGIRIAGSAEEDLHLEEAAAEVGVSLEEVDLSAAAARREVGDGEESIHTC
jgi:hypothetical protein